MQDNVFIVCYVTGTYEDRAVVNYKVCFSKQTADNLSQAMNEYSKEYGVDDSVGSFDEDIFALYDAKCDEFRKKFNVENIDCLTGIKFFVQSVEVYRESI